MAAVFNMLARIRKSPSALAPEQAAPAHDTSPRSPEQMIAGCEYELRQLRRDVQLTRRQPLSTPAPKTREPFLRAPGRAAS